MYDTVLETYTTIEVHIILESFTVSAAERYKECIKMFCNKCMNSSTQYSKLIEKMCIYNTPSMIEHISLIIKPYIDPNLSQSIILYTKDESSERLKTLLDM